MNQQDVENPSNSILIYTQTDSKPSSPKPTGPTTGWDILSEYPQGGVKHVFAAHGPKARPIHVDVNGRKGRRAICVLYGDSMRYEVLDLDAAIEEEEEQGDEENEYSDDDLVEEQEEAMDSDSEN